MVLKRPILIAVILFGLAPPFVSSASALNEPIQPIPLRADLDQRKVSLGKRLFNDTRLSRDGSIACVTCHNLQNGGADGRALPEGIEGRIGSVNTPTVFNAALNFKQFWDGRAKNLAEQIDAVVIGAAEFDTNWSALLSKLRAEPSYVTAFNALYPDGISEANVKDAIVTFEHTLITPSRFDRFLRGDSEAITKEEREGYQLFKAYGCIACHQGTNIGGNLFQKLGIFGDYFAQRGSVKANDQGRFNLTGQQQDRNVFKVPSLRNVAVTGPYFHDGSAPTLEQAVRTMAEFQLGVRIPPQDEKLIIQFLNSLTGSYQGEVLQ